MLEPAKAIANEPSDRRSKKNKTRIVTQTCYGDGKTLSEAFETALLMAINSERLKTECGV